MKRFLSALGIGIVITLVLLHFGIRILDYYIPVIRLDSQLTEKCNAYSSIEMKDDYPDIFIPHPYFGYVYTPNKEFVQQFTPNKELVKEFPMKANSDGFIDAEFPTHREPDLVVYAIMGGSAAMSWGVVNNNERVNHFLENMLNEYSQAHSLKKRFRVLNLAVGSHTQYQATQIFQYYKNIIDGVIMYSGHNEVSHGNQIRELQVPVRYPSAFETMIVSRGEYGHKKRINALNQDIKFFCGHYNHGTFTGIMALRVLRLREALRSIDYENEQMAQTEKEAHLPKIQDVVTKGLPPIFTSNLDYHFSTDPKFLAPRLEVMRTVVPLVYTEPLLDAFALAKRKGIEFLHVIQPMLGTVKKTLSQEELKVWDMEFLKPCKPNCSVVQYEVDGLKVLRGETQRLVKEGITVLDFNQPGLFDDLNSKSMFLDTCHLMPLGNERVAQILFNEIKSRWPHLKDQRVYLAR